MGGHGHERRRRIYGSFGVLFARALDGHSALTAWRQALLKSASNNVVLIREKGSECTAVSTFDHNDLNAYLLVVVGLAHPPDDLVDLYDSLAKKAQANESIPLRDIQVCG